MKYKIIYDKIIQNRQANPVDGYTENHHIKPRCLGGKETVALTAREHFICHYLLAKMYDNGTNEWYKLNHAFMMMKCVSLEQPRYFNSKMYEELRVNFSEVMSRTQLGKKNSQFGSIWISNIELKQNKKINKGIEIPDGWVKGRNKWVKKPVRVKKPYSRLTFNWFPFMENISNEYEVIKKKVSINKKFIKICLENQIPKNQILLFLGCSNSGPNYKTINALVYPLATNE